MLVVALLAFVLSPVTVMPSHGAAAWIAAAEIIAHGHAHGHAHDHAHGDDPAHGRHDVTDHDHQIQALAIAPGDALPPAALRGLSDRRMAGLVRDGPRRPPRPS
jgi:hypothetical protein